MRTIPGTRTLDGHGYSHVFADFTKSADIIHPFFLIEVNGEKTTSIISKNRVDTDYMTSLEMVDNDLVGHWEELSIRTLTAFYCKLIRLSTQAGHPMISAIGR
jgi:hypothetical protein